jgi:hypothetical protein
VIAAVIFIGRRLAGDVPGKPLLSSFEKLLGPSVVEVLSDAFLAAELGDAVLAAQDFEDDADLLLGCLDTEARSEALTNVALTNDWRPRRA